MARIPDRTLRHSKSRDRALILPFVGLLLLTPPIAKIFPLDLTLFGLPGVWVYVFAVWAGLIAVAALLSRNLSDPNDGSATAEDLQDNQKTSA
ncbi:MULTISPECIES: hypothetical protein [Limibacillus]|jgi:hypothetical protein|uniref:DUF3311 domain-containing protein n=1 Tax=Limibacillus halophilus TaxID=1579333 RepID=A0A839STQ2_9PROT|nr:hypothetical protein [Limibacillus halophilus]MBB3066171.1 hypothetical protein [Limibacillus halophilus]